jgi:hypothetical protein
MHITREECQIVKALVADMQRIPAAKLLNPHCVTSESSGRIPGRPVCGDRQIIAE